MALLADCKCASSMAQVQPQNDYFRRHNVCGPQDLGETGGDRDPLLASRCIGDDPTTDGATNFPAPQFMSSSCVDSIKISTHIAEEHNPSRRRRHAALDGVICLNPPFPCAGIGVIGINPTGPFAKRIRL